MKHKRLLPLLALPALLAAGAAQAGLVLNPSFEANYRLWLAINRPCLSEEQIADLAQTEPPPKSSSGRQAEARRKRRYYRPP